MSEKLFCLPRLSIEGIYRPCGGGPSLPDVSQDPHNTRRKRNENIKREEFLENITFSLHLLLHDNNNKDDDKEDNEDNDKDNNNKDNDNEDNNNKDNDNKDTDNKDNNNDDNEDNTDIRTVYFV